MTRRQFLRTAAFTPLVVVLGSKFVATLRHYPLTDLQQRLRAMQPDRLRSMGNWNVSQIFQHCAQNLRYSIVGYPQHHSVLQKNIVGKLALNFYAAIGSMPAAQEQPIPGAPPLAADVPNDVALNELMFELQEFINWQGELAAHFAYGSLTKAQYYKVHALFLEQQLQQIVSR
ncbi:DUF1569 domain-containing protein [Alishewanella sp. SMS9]|nr:DUF1569 domain-containing protein [Alishewanella sp. SMS9]